MVWPPQGTTRALSRTTSDQHLGSVFIPGGPPLGQCLELVFREGEPPPDMHQ
jgi:hypothetical protein